MVVVALAGCRQWYGLDTPVLARDASGPEDDAPLDGVTDAPADAITLASACPASYTVISTNGPRYRHVTTAVDWTDAQPFCANDALPGSGVHTHLAVFANDSERADVNGLLPTTVWIGLSDRVVSGQWKWVTLEPAGTYPPITVPPWAIGEPDGATHCGAMDENGNFESRDCNGTADVPFVCECDFFPDTPSQHQ